MTGANPATTKLGRRAGTALPGVWLLLALLLPAAVSAHPKEPKPRSQASKGVVKSPAERLDNLVRSLPAKKVIAGISVREARSGQVVFQHNASLPLIPASNAKLFVMAAALDQFGPDFRFVTRLMLRGEDLVVVGSGDPGFGDPRLCEARGQTISAPMDRWASALRDREVVTIPGDLILDESLFDQEFTHPQWEVTDLQRWYGAPVGALNFNDNCVELTLRPAPKSGQPVLWDIIPENSLVTLDNRCLSGGKGTPTIQRTDIEFRYLVNGRCSKPWPLPPIAVPDPGVFFGDVLRTSLARHGITIAGRLVRWHAATARDGSEYEPVAEESTTLIEVLSRVGKDSQNVFAECLAKRLGCEWARIQGHASPRGSWATARGAIQAFLERVAYDPRLSTSESWTGLVIDDASGLSRANRTTADQIARVLAYMAVHPHGELFASSLSVTGRDGSLERRGGLRELTGRLAGKTGTLRGVRALSGYLDTDAGDRLAFSIILNDNGGAKVSLNELADQVCAILADWPSADTKRR